MTITTNLHRLAALIDRIDTETGPSHPAEPHLEEAAALVSDLLTMVTGEDTPNSVQYLAKRYRDREGA